MCCSCYARCGLAVICGSCSAAYCDAICSHHLLQLLCISMFAAAPNLAKQLPPESSIKSSTVQSVLAAATFCSDGVCCNWLDAHSLGCIIFVCLCAASCYLQTQHSECSNGCLRCPASATAAPQHGSSNWQVAPATASWWHALGASYFYVAWLTIIDFIRTVASAAVFAAERMWCTACCGGSCLQPEGMQAVQTCGCTSG